MMDYDLMTSFNTYGGYLLTSGYDKVTIVKAFTNIFSKSNKEVAFKPKVLYETFKIAFVTKLHPALPNLNSLIQKP